MKSAIAGDINGSVADEEFMDEKCITARGRVKANDVSSALFHWCSSSRRVLSIRAAPSNRDDAPSPASEEVVELLPDDDNTCTFKISQVYPPLVNVAAHSSARLR